MSGSLEAPTRTLVRVSAVLATRDEARIRDVLESATEHDPAIEVEEVLVQSYLFLGFPAALNALGVWRDCSGRRPPAATGGALGTWERRGEEVCRRVYGDIYPRLRGNIAALHPDMDRWMVTEGYGKVLGRSGLGLREREICIAALLAVLDAPVQLRSHFRGCVRLGASPEEMEEVLEIVGEFASEPVHRKAGEILARVLHRRE